MCIRDSNYAKDAHAHTHTHTHTHTILPTLFWTVLHITHCPPYQYHPLSLFSPAVLCITHSSLYRPLSSVSPNCPLYCCHWRWEKNCVFVLKIRGFCCCCFSAFPVRSASSLPNPLETKNKKKWCLSWAGNQMCTYDLVHFISPRWLQKCTPGPWGLVDLLYFAL